MIINRQYPAENITAADYADDLVLLTVQVESPLHILE